MKPDWVIKHIPYGLGPYRKSGYERVPAEPLDGEPVAVNAIIRTNTKPDIVLNWRIINSTRQGCILPSKNLPTQEGLYSCSFELGSFDESDKVAYFLQLEGEDRVIRTREYEFTVFHKYRLNEIEDVKYDNGLLVLCFKEESIHRGKLCLSFEEGSLRMYFTLNAALPRGKGGCFFIPKDDKQYIYKDNKSGYYVEVRKEPFKFLLMDGMNSKLLESKDDPAGFIELYGNSAGKVRSVNLRFKVCNEHFYGFGERFNGVDQSGMSPDIFTKEWFTYQGEITYLPIPFFLTEKNYGIYSNSTFYSKYRLGTASDKFLEIQTNLNNQNPFVDMYVIFGSPKTAIKKYMEMTGGKPVLPPKWTFGPWMSGNEWNTQKKILEQVDLTLKHEIPATVVVLEAWSDETTFYIFNDARYKKCTGDKFLSYGDFSFDAEGRWPDPKGMIDYIHENKMKLVLWQICAVKFIENCDNEQHNEDQQYVIDAGYCLKNPDGTPYRIADNWFNHSLLPDFTNPAMREWWFNKRRYLLEELGVDGFKTDGSETVFFDDICFYNGKKGDEMRNRYPGEYISAYHDFIGRDRITFSRAGGTGAHRYPIHWAGDQESTWSEYRSVLSAGLSAGLSGIPFWSFDIAGFWGDVPSAELYLRSTAMAAFCPIMQYHSSPEKEDRTPWSISERNNDWNVLEGYRRYANTRMNLLPYIYREAQYVSDNSEPMMRHLIVDYPGDENVYTIHDEYMFGRYVLVAPIIIENAKERDIYLPAGEWIDFWNGCMYSGNMRITYKCDIDKIPVFIKNNSVIPMNLNDNFEVGGKTGSETDKYKNLCFVVFGNIGDKYDFSDDLGNNIAIEQLTEGFKVKITGEVDKIFILTRNPSLAGEGGRSARINGMQYLACEFMKGEK